MLSDNFHNLNFQREDIMNRTLFLVLPLLLLTSNSKAMESKLEEIAPEQLPECTRWETLKWRFHFYLKGYKDRWHRDDLLKSLATHYDPKNLLMMHYLSCSNKTLIKRENMRLEWPDYGPAAETNEKAFKIALESKNIPLIKMFLRNGVHDVLGAIKTSEEITKLHTDAGIFCGEIEVFCKPNDPGYSIYKQAYQRSLEKRNKDLRESCS